MSLQTTGKQNRRSLHLDIKDTEMFDSEPTARSRVLGMCLLRAIRNHGWNASELARALGWSPTKVSRILSGKRPASVVDIAAVLAACHVKGKEREVLLELAADARDLNWLLDDEDHRAVRFSVVADLECTATTITCAAYFAVPELLQSESYARAIVAHSPSVRTGSAHADARVTQILARQAVMDRAELQQCTFFVDEAVVARSGMDREIMSDQVHHMLRMSIRHNVDIRIVPEGACRVMHEPFELLEFSEDRLPIVCIKSLTAITLLGRATAALSYERLISELADVALTCEQTRIWLREFATALSRPDRNGEAFRLEPEGVVSTET